MKILIIFLVAFSLTNANPCIKNALADSSKASLIEKLKASCDEFSDTPSLPHTTDLSVTGSSPHTPDGTVTSTSFPHTTDKTVTSTSFPHTTDMTVTSTSFPHTTDLTVTKTFHTTHSTTLKPACNMHESVCNVEIQNLDILEVVNEQAREIARMAGVLDAIWEKMIEIP